MPISINTGLTVLEPSAVMQWPDPTTGLVKHISSGMSQPCKDCGEIKSLKVLKTDRKREDGKGKSEADCWGGD